MKTKKKTKSPLTVQQKFDKLSRLKKIDILWEALDYMRQYNGRNKWDCIALAMNIENLH